MEFRRAAQVKKTLAEFRGEAVFCFSSKSLTGIKDDDSRFLRQADSPGKGIAGEFLPAQVQHLKSALEEQTFEPYRESRAAFEEQDGWKMAMAGVALLGRHGSFEHAVRSKFFFYPIRRCGRVFLNHSSAHGSVGGRVDQNKTARGSVTRIGIEKQADMGLELHRADFVHLQSSRRLTCQRIEVDAMANVQRPDFCLANGVFDQIGFS